MEAIAYEPLLHFEEVCAWARARGISEPPFSGLPKTGRVVPGHCALFLYQTDSSAGFIESLISNPSEEKTRIAEAIDLCADALEQDAMRLGMRYLIGTSFIPAVIEHAKRHGYAVKQESYRLFAKELP